MLHVGERRRHLSSASLLASILTSSDSLWGGEGGGEGGGGGEGWVGLRYKDCKMEERFNELKRLLDNYDTMESILKKRSVSKASFLRENVQKATVDIQNVRNEPLDQNAADWWTSCSIDNIAYFTDALPLQQYSQILRFLPRLVNVVTVMNAQPHSLTFSLSLFLSFSLSCTYTHTCTF